MFANLLWLFVVILIHMQPCGLIRNWGCRFFLQKYLTYIKYKVTWQCVPVRLITINLLWNKNKQNKSKQNVLLFKIHYRRQTSLTRIFYFFFCQMRDLNRSCKVSTKSKINVNKTRILKVHTRRKSISSKSVRR